MSRNGPVKARRVTAWRGAAVAQKPVLRASGDSFFLCVNCIIPRCRGARLSPPACGARFVRLAEWLMQTPAIARPIPATRPGDAGTATTAVAPLATRRELIRVPRRAVIAAERQPLQPSWRALSFVILVLIP